MAGVAIEGQQRMVHMLPIVAVVAHAFLLPMGRIIRAVEVQDNPARGARAAAFPDVQLDQRGRELFDPVAVDRILQPGEGRLTG